MLDWRVPGYRGLAELRTGTVVARHEASGHPVLLRYHPPGPEPVLARRRGDARALAGLASPHIANLYEHIEVALPSGDVPPVGAVTVREYVAGASVRSLLAGSALAPESALGLLRTGLLALRCAHERGVAHRGYKPENLLVAADGTARLADFAANPDPDHDHDHDHDDGADGADRSDDDAQPPAEPWTVADVRAAFAVFVACLGTRADRLPRRVRPLAAPGEAGDGAALLEAVEQAGRAGWGPQWQARGERELARRVARVARRGTKA